MKKKDIKTFTMYSVKDRPDVRWTVHSVMNNSVFLTERKTGSTGAIHDLPKLVNTKTFCETARKINMHF